MPEGLNPVARRVEAALVKNWPKFRRKLRALAGGHFEAALLAPTGSRAVALVCTTSGDGEVWLRLGVPRAFYSVNSVVELKKVVKAILSEKVLFAVTEHDGTWTGTTLLPPSTLPQIEPGETCRLYSWSGSKDLDIFRPVNQRPRRTRKS